MGRRVYGTDRISGVLNVEARDIWSVDTKGHGLDKGKDTNRGTVTANVSLGETFQMTIPFGRSKRIFLTKVF